MKNQISKLFSLAFCGVLLSNFSAKAVENNYVQSLSLQNNNTLKITQNSSQVSTNSNVLTETELNQQINQFMEVKNCRITQQSQPKQKIQAGIVQKLLNCIGYSFEIVDQESSNPSTALTVKRYPILVLQKGDEYKVKFSQKPKVANPRIIITWTKDGSSEFGDSYTPLQRALIVTEKFNQHFIQNGEIEIPPLSKGVFNKQAVVCAASSGNCNQDNILWTLKSANRKSDILVNLNLALRGDAGATIYESDDPQIKEQKLEKELENEAKTAELVDSFVEQVSEELEKGHSDEVLTSELKNNQSWDDIQSDRVGEIDNSQK